MEIVNALNRPSTSTSVESDNAVTPPEEITGSQNTANQPKLLKCPSFETKFNAGKFGQHNLNDYFVYNGSVPIAPNVPGPNKVLTCKLCHEEKKGDGVGNFERHLQKRHKDVSLSLRLECQESSRDFLKSDAIPPKQVKKIALTSDQQLCLKQCMVDLVAVDGLPLSLSKAFRSFVTMFLPQINLQSRRTITRDLNNFVSNDIKLKLKEIPRDVPYLHLTLDIWSSRTRESVIGVKCQFLNDAFQLEHHTLAFTQFHESHTGENILLKLEEILGNLGVSSTQIVTACVDNASNMIKAFNLQALYSEPWENQVPDDDSYEQLDDAWNDESWILVQDTITKAKWNRLACIAHTLQLVVVNNLKNDTSTKPVWDYVHGIIMFFRKSTKWTEKLRSQSNGLDLVCPVQTRWNSLCFAMERFLMPGMKAAITRTLMEALSSKESSLATHGVTNAPSPGVFAKIKDLHNLLSPLKNATDCLQGDGPQIALVVLKLLEAFETIYSNTNTKFSTLKDKILTDMESRFSCLLSDPFYIIPAMVDPRQKLFVFEDDFSVPPWAEMYPDFKTPSKQDATEMLTNFASEFFVARTQNQAARVDEGEPKLQNAYFSLLQRKRQRLEPGSLQEMIHSYVNEATSNPEWSCPLAYWRLNQTKYSALAALAKRHLSAPATSAACERMFSAGGSLKRARRARLGINIVEDCLIYNEYRKPQLDKILLKSSSELDT